VLDGARHVGGGEDPLDADDAGGAERGSDAGVSYAGRVSSTTRRVRIRESARRISRSGGADRVDERDLLEPRSMIAVGLAAFVTGVAPAIAAGAHANSTPVGALPTGPVSTVTTSPNQLVAVALPDARKRSGLIWKSHAGTTRVSSDRSQKPTSVRTSSLSSGSSVAATRRSSSR
jgi:hypothetical protein